MKDNVRIAIGYFCVALVFISYFLMMAWILSPQEFTVKFEMDDNTREAIESIEYPIVDAGTNEDCEVLVLKDLEDVKLYFMNERDTLRKCYVFQKQGEGEE